MCSQLPALAWLGVERHRSEASGCGRDRRGRRACRTHLRAAGAGPRGLLAVLQPRALLARLQRSRPPARRGHLGAAAGAGQVLRDLGVEPGRVLHGAGGEPSRPARGRGRCARRRRDEPERPDRRDPRAGARPARAADAMLRARASPGARRARDPDHLAPAGERGRARAARPGVREEHLPGADPAGDRPRPPLPVHLEPLAEPRRHAPRPRPGHRGARPGEGAEGAAGALREDRRRRGDAGPARGPDRGQPGLPVPGHGGHGPLLLPGHPRHRLRRLRRGRRPASGGRGGASPPPLRRGRAARGRPGDEPAAARAAPRRAVDRRAPAL